MHNYIIETERLILRPLKIEDAEAVYQWVSDERVAKYMVYNTYTSLEAVVEWLTMLQKPDEEYHFGFVRKEDDLLNGSYTNKISSLGRQMDRQGNGRLPCHHSCTIFNGSFSPARRLL